MKLRFMRTYPASWLPLLFLLILFLAVSHAHVAAVPPHHRRQVSNTTSSRDSSRFEPGWVAPPNSRGTINLVFSCVITLFLCAWTTVHVNIEPENEINHILSQILPLPGLKDNERVGRFLASRKIRKLGWGCLTLIVPEGAMAIAAFERRMARLLRSRINEEIRRQKRAEMRGEKPREIQGEQPNEMQGEKPNWKPEEEWDMALAYYAVMGGFVIREVDYDAAIPSGGGMGEAIPPVSDRERATSTSPPTATGEKNGEPAGSPPSKPMKNKPLTLTPFGVLRVKEMGLLPPIRSAEVRDKSNADSLAKAIVFWQALWMIVQVIGRKAADLPITLLELHTVLHTFCAAVMYISWWSKPVDIDLPTEVHLGREDVELLIKGTDKPDPTNPLITRPPITTTTTTTSSSIKPTSSATMPTSSNTFPNSTEHNTSSPIRPTEDDASSSSSSSADIPTTAEVKHAYLVTRAGLGEYMYRHLCGYHKSIRRDYFTVLNDAYTRLWRGRKNVKLEGLSISLVGLIYGGVHLAAWNYRFPSVAETWLWRISALVTATAWSGFVVSLWASVLLEMGPRRFRRAVGWLCGLGFGVGIFPCFLFRLFLLVESFVEIRMLPLGSYDLPRWANAIPHAG